MRHHRLLTLLIAASSVTLLAATALAADPTGTWTWSFTGQGGQTRESTLTLKLDGDKLTGTLARGRQGRSTEISNGAFKDGEVSFDITATRGDRTFTQKYKGKLEGDTIKGTIQGGRQGGEGRTRDWEAKRK